MAALPCCKPLRICSDDRSYDLCFGALALVSFFCVLRKLVPVSLTGPLLMTFSPLEDSVCGGYLKWFLARALSPTLGVPFTN